MKNIIRTLFGEVDLDKLKNPKLRKVMKDRIDQFSFLFNYGDNIGDKHIDCISGREIKKPWYGFLDPKFWEGHTDYRKHTEGTVYREHKYNYNVHIDKSSPCNKSTDPIGHHDDYQYNDTRWGNCQGRGYNEGYHTEDYVKK